MVGLQAGEIVPVPLEKITSNSQSPNPEYFEIAKMLAQ
jgi:hypothetical protein